METAFNLEQLQEKFDVSVRTWREYIKRKELKAFKIGRTYHVFEQDLMAFIKNKEVYTQREKGAYSLNGKVL